MVVYLKKFALDHIDLSEWEDDFEIEPITDQTTNLKFKMTSNKDDFKIELWKYDQQEYMGF